MSETLVNILVWAGGLITFVTFIKGISHCYGAFYMFSILGDPPETLQLHRDVTAVNATTRFFGGVVMITVNVWVLAMFLSVTGKTSYGNPYDMFDYSVQTLPTEYEAKISLLLNTMFKTSGAWAVYIGSDNLTRINHPDEQERRIARQKAGWGFACGIFMMFFPFFANVVANDTDSKLIDELARLLNLVNL